jgi:EAL domain-containing protein (putative c-di-GMP-specific phosphodiesterase class I)
MASSLRLKVVAEGVETNAQLGQLRRFGCQELQGYIFSKPLPPDELLALLQEGRRLPLAGA